MIVLCKRDHTVGDYPIVWVRTLSFREADVVTGSPFSLSSVCERTGLVLQARRWFPSRTRPVLLNHVWFCPVNTVIGSLKHV